MVTWSLDKGAPWEVLLVVLLLVVTKAGECGGIEPGAFQQESGKQAVLASWRKEVTRW